MNANPFLTILYQTYTQVWLRVMSGVAPICGYVTAFMNDDCVIRHTIFYYILAVAIFHTRRHNSMKKIK